MKLTFLFMLTGLIAVSASTYSQNTRLDIKVKDNSIIDLFKEIEANSEFYFFYQKEELAELENISVTKKNAKVTEILDEALEGTTLEYKIVDRYIIIRKDGLGLEDVESITDQQKTITGKITDESGQSLPGVTILIKGTTNGTVSDLNGKFTLSEVSNNATLVFSFIGMLSQGIIVGSQTKLDITMRTDAIGIDEVVAVGYGTQKKVNLTGAISTVESKKLENTSVSSLSNALAGLVPGMTVIQSNGRPGSSSSINIRGMATWNNSDPLYVIDGIVRDKEAFDALDVNEVGSMSVLKDAASASIYGSRAANGVILITTKRGKIQRPQITYKGSISIESPTTKIDQLSAYEAAMVFNDKMDTEGKPADDFGRFAEDELNAFKDESVYNSWLDDAWENPVSQQHNLNINGGTEKIRYFMSAGLNDATGFLKSISYKKQNFRMNVETEITKNLIADVRLDMNMRTSDQPYWPNDGGQYDMYDLYNGLLIRPSYQKAYIGDKAVNYGSWHPSEAANSGYNEDNQSIFNGLIGLTYSVPWVKGLKLNAKYNQTRRNQFRKQLYEHSYLTTFEASGSHNHLVAEDATIVGDRYITVRPYEYIAEEYQRSISYQFNTSISYQNTFDRHFIDAIFAYEQSEYNHDEFSGKAEDFLSTSVDQMFAASDNSERRTATGQGYESGRLSYVGRINYVYADKYLFESSFRYDGSARFAEDNRWGFFPSVSTGWRISEESFFKNNINSIDYLKLRASYGSLGNDNVAAYQYVQSYKFKNTMYYNEAFKTLMMSTMPNQMITWEKTKTYNIGIDAALLDNKFTFAGDFFYRHTYDILGPREQSVPESFGAELPDLNYGVVDVKGLEVTAGYNDMIGKVNYYVSANLGYAMDEVITIDVAQDVREYKNPIGLPLNTVWGYPTEGIVRTQAELDEYMSRVSSMKGKTPYLGSVLYQDVRGASDDNPDGIVDSYDQSVLSKYANPKLNYGLNLGASWNGFTVDALFQGVGRWDRMMSGNGRKQKINNGNTVLGLWRDHWTPDEPDAEMPVIGDQGIHRDLEFWMDNAAFLRLKNLSARYSLPRRITSSLGAENIAFTISGTNIFTWTKFKYYDPEQRLIESYPVMKSVSLGLNVTF